MASLCSQLSAPTLRDQPLSEDVHQGIHPKKKKKKKKRVRNSLYTTNHCNYYPPARPHVLEAAVHSLRADPGAPELVTILALRLQQLDAAE